MQFDRTNLSCTGSLCGQWWVSNAYPSTDKDRAAQHSANLGGEVCVVAHPIKCRQFLSFLRMHTRSHTRSHRAAQASSGRMWRSAVSASLRATLVCVHACMCDQHRATGVV